MKKYLYSLLFLTSLQATIHTSATWSVIFAKPYIENHHIYKFQNPNYFEGATELIITLEYVPEGHQQDLEIPFTQNVLDAIKMFNFKNLQSIDICDTTQTKAIKKIKPFPLSQGFKEKIAIMYNKESFLLVHHGTVVEGMMEKIGNIYKKK